MSIIFPTRSKPTPVIDIINMVDVVFLMLIFFTLFTTFGHEENRLQIELPNTTNKENNAEDKHPLVLSINKNNEVFWEQEKVTVEELETKIKTSNNIQNRTLVIQADAKTEHGQVIRVFDILRRNKILRLNIATDLSSPPPQAVR